MPRTDPDECDGCGSKLEERQRWIGGNPALTTDKMKCVSCGAEKCCRCDKGTGYDDCLKCEISPL